MRGKGGMVLWIGIVLLLSGLFFLGAVRVKVLVLRYDISRLQSLKEDLLGKRKELELERTMLLSPSELEDRAQEELGMKYPEPSEVVLLGRGR